MSSWYYFLWKDVFFIKHRRNYYSYEIVFCEDETMRYGLHTISSEIRSEDAMLFHKKQCGSDTVLRRGCLKRPCHKNEVRHWVSWTGPFSPSSVVRGPIPLATRTGRHSLQVTRNRENYPVGTTRRYSVWSRPFHCSFHQRKHQIQTCQLDVCVVPDSLISSACGVGRGESITKWFLFFVYGFRWRLHS